MAAMRNPSKNFMFGCISNPISSFLSSSPAILISCRGLASKLFVGDTWGVEFLFVHQLTIAYGMVQPKYVKHGWVANVQARDATSGLSYYTSEEGLSEAFSQYGQVIEAKIVMDRVSDRSKGFGFVSYASENEAEKAITEMNGKALNGRAIFVDYAKPRSGYGGGMPIARGPPETALDN